MEADFIDASNINKEKNEIKWEYLGRYFSDMKAFGNIINRFRCPSCRSELVIYRRKGLLKTKCEKCNWENINKAKDMFKVREEYSSESFRNLFVDK